MSAAVRNPDIAYAYSTPKLPPRITEEEYEAVLEKSVEKLEFRNGQIIMMAGGGDTHSLVKGNAIHQLKAALSKRPCRVYDSDMKVKIEASSLNTFPDAAIVCGKPQFKNDKRNTLLNPGVLIEVLSDSTEAYDRGEKFWHYRHLPSLRTYVLLSSEQIRAEVFDLCEDGTWALTTFDGFDAILKLRHHEIEIPLAALYEKTILDPASPLEEEV
ncbi:MAG: Uma2 family endonuclease [Prosthecobacter sp.]|uniref:Uma2 family endonuclease n=1 Tax=Prosthecobacter sp. TaxID=1965333 RepID=UPI0038FDE946